VCLARPGMPGQVRFSLDFKFSPKVIPNLLMGRAHLEALAEGLHEVGDRVLHRAPAAHRTRHPLRNLQALRVRVVPAGVAAWS